MTKEQAHQLHLYILRNFARIGITARTLTVHEAEQEPRTFVILAYRNKFATISDYTRHAAINAIMDLRGGATTT